MRISCNSEIFSWDQRRSFGGDLGVDWPGFRGAKPHRRSAGSRVLRLGRFEAPRTLAE